MTTIVECESKECGISHRINRDSFSDYALRSVFLALSLVIVDLFAAYCATIIGVYCTTPDLSFAQFWPSPLALWPYRLGFLFSAIIAYLAVKGRYTGRISLWTEAPQIFWCAVLACIMEVWVGVSNNELAARSPAIVAIAVFPIFAVVLGRALKKALLSSGLWTIRIVAVGDDKRINDIEAAFDSDPLLGYQIVAKLDVSPTVLEPDGTGPIAALGFHDAKCLLVAVDGQAELQRSLINAATQRGVNVLIAPPESVLPSYAGRATRLPGHDAQILSLGNSVAQPLARFSKAAMDVTIAFILLVIVSPLFLMIALAIRLDGGPVIFRQRRIGAAGRPFVCLKFRTMVVEADAKLEKILAADAALAAEWVARRKLVRDPRITRVGRVLRKTSLDELPQLINVLRREMSLVGPRPIVASEVAFYGDSIGHYFAVRPGLTGLWQVSGRSNMSYARRVQLDVWYVKNWSLWNDVVVLLRTVPAVLHRQGAC